MMEQTWWVGRELHHEGQSAQASKAQIGRDKGDGGGGGNDLMLEKHATDDRQGLGWDLTKVTSR